MQNNRKTAPQPKASEDSKSLTVLIDRNAKKIEAFMRERGIYNESMEYQVGIAARFFAQIQKMEEYMSRDDYTMIVELESQYGVREDLHPLEKKYGQVLSAWQSSIKALGLNRDSKPQSDVSSSSDSLSDFMKAMNEE